MKRLVMLVLVLIGLVVQEGKGQGLPAQWVWAALHSVVAPAPDGGFYQAKTIINADTIGGQIFIPHGTIQSWGYPCDIVLTRFNSQNQPLWSKLIGGNGFDIPKNITVDSSGRVILGSTYKDTINIGSTTIYPAGGSSDIFYAGYDSAGTLDWVTTLATPGEEVISQQVANTGGGAFLIATINYGPTAVPFGPDTLQTDSGKLTVFAQLDENGQWEWTKKLKNANGKIKTDVFNNCYLYGGIMADTFQIGGIYPNTDRAVLLAKFNSTGTIQWLKTFPAVVGNAINILVYPSGEIDLRIRFAFSVTLDTISLSSTQLADSWVRLNASGNVLSAQPDILMHQYQLVVSPSGDMLMAGYFTDSLRFRNNVIFSEPGLHFYIARMGLTDTTFWLHDLNNAHGGSSILGFALGSDNDVYITGTTNDMLEIDTLLFAHAAPDGGTDFVARLRLSSPVMASPNHISVSDSGLDIFPNPASINATVRFMQSIPNTALLKFIDATGRIVREEYTKRGEVNLSGLSPGIYFVNAQSGNLNWHQKLMIR